ncbi:MAG: hypothetical protein F6K18_08185 [Okeania sp. SIO2C2]|uniref:hypothetical protein n=1 Tax=Okeania sp. SIO2C2 TaxID=2607787 RepID=UPI0013B77BBD|nr:hypothetical protein [Okeania sp. SIO2C2]NEP86813.1 hypothetical protein [Okeania sp. SIO2C2]
MIVHRPIPDGFVIKTATITKKADSYYISLSLEEHPPLTPPGRVTEGVGLIPTDNIKTAVGIDLG